MLCFRHAYNIAINDVHVMLVKSLLDLLLKESGATDSAHLLTSLRPVRFRLISWFKKDVHPFLSTVLIEGTKDFVLYIGLGKRCPFISLPPY